jgi:hypothetical protein
MSVPGNAEFGVGYEFLQVATNLVSVSIFRQSGKALYHFRRGETFRER